MMMALLLPAACVRPQAISTGQRIALAASYCLSGEASPSFGGRDEACAYYQTHFIPASTGTPRDLLAYIAASRTRCALDARQCPLYWNSVSQESVLVELYPGIDVRDPQIWAAKRAAVRACTDDGPAIGPGGIDAKPAACGQAARLLRGDRLEPALLRRVERKACELGVPDECHYATMDGESVDIKASQAVEAERARQTAAAVR